MINWEDFTKETTSLFLRVRFNRICFEKNYDISTLFYFKHCRESKTVITSNISS